MAAIGIDLGTTNCCVTICLNGLIEVMPQYTDKRTISSYICFTQNEIIFGDTAKIILPRNVKNTVYDVKRLIGRNFSDPAVQNYIDRWGFAVLVDEGRLKVSVSYGDDTKLFTPEELSGLFLKELKQKAENYLDTNVTKVVITVPSYFNDAQRQATIDAGRIAGFLEVKLLNEPTAAAIAYIYRNASVREKTIFIFDLGGGTFDVSIVKYKNKTIDVLAIDGNFELGGNDIDNALVDHIKGSRSLNTDKLYRLKQVCENVKKQLSETGSAFIELYGEDDMETIVTRELFNKLNQRIYDELKKIVHRCLERAKIGITDIDDVILVGGSTKICKIAEIIEFIFKKRPKSNINPDEAVAIGAGVVASKWSDNPEFVELEFNDICPYSLGIRIKDIDTSTLIMDVLIPKFTQLPAQCTKNHWPSTDYQEETVFRVLSGEQRLSKDNTEIGKMIISGYKIGPKNSIDFKTTFRVDKNGVLTVSILDCTTETSRALSIKLDKGRFTNDELIAKANHINELYLKNL